MLNSIETSSACVVTHIIRDPVCIVKGVRTSSLFSKADLRLPISYQLSETSNISLCDAAAAGSADNWCLSVRSIFIMQKQLTYLLMRATCFL